MVLNGVQVYYVGGQVYLCWRVECLNGVVYGVQVYCVGGWMIEWCTSILCWRVDD